MAAVTYPNRTEDMILDDITSTLEAATNYRRPVDEVHAAVDRLGECTIELAEATGVELSHRVDEVDDAVQHIGRRMMKWIGPSTLRLNDMSATDIPLVEIIEDSTGPPEQSRQSTDERTSA